MGRAGIAAVSAALVVSGTWLNGQASAEKALQIADGMQVTLEYTLTLPDKTVADSTAGQAPSCPAVLSATVDRKSTRLNSSHGYISYAVFCLKKKKISKTMIMQLSMRS